MKLKNKRAGKGYSFGSFKRITGGDLLCVCGGCDVVVEILCGGRNWRLRGRRGEQVRKRE